MKKKGTFVSLFMALILFIFSERTVFAAEAINEIVAPTGVKAFLVLIPLVLVLVLLFKKVYMIIAGLIAGILAMIIGGISLAEANSSNFSGLEHSLCFSARGHHQEKGMDS